MGRWVTRSWQSTYDGGLRRRDRRSGEYVTYIPDPSWVLVSRGPLRQKAWRLRRRPAREP